MTERIVAKEKPFPDDLEGRLNAILNVINGEYKALALLHLDTEHTIGGEGLRTRICRTLGTDFYIPHAKAIGSYCNLSLYPIGTVAKEVILSEGDITLQTGYKLTKAGLKYGLPISAFALHWAASNNKSLCEVLGSTQSSGDSRAPFNRIKILERFSSKDDLLKESDFVKTLDIFPVAVRTHLVNLRKIGFIDFQSIGKNRDPERRSGFYEFVHSDAPLPSIERTRTTLIEDVYNVLRTLKEADYIKVCEFLKIERSKENVSRILKRLEREGHARKIGKWKVHEYFSKVKLLDEGARFVNSFIESIRESLSNERNLEELSNEFLAPLTNNPLLFREIARNSTSLYQSASSHIKSKDREHRYYQIQSLIGRDGQATSDVIAKQLDISTSHARKLLSELEKIDILKCSENKNYEKVYSLS